MPIHQEQVIRVFRVYKCSSGYFGIAAVADKLFYTCELLPNNNQRLSCIPADEYALAPFQGKRFKNVFHITDVPNRKWILTHWGNTMVDTRGCILFGRGLWSKGKEMMITHSRKACEDLWKLQPTSIIINNVI